MFHLDYLSSFLTVLATILLARKSWTGLLIAIVNSLIVCAIALRTSQLGFIPANCFASAYTGSACGRGSRNKQTQIEIRRSLSQVFTTADLAFRQPPRATRKGLTRRNSESTPQET
jgi:hypothetical protein